MVEELLIKGLKEILLLFKLKEKVLDMAQQQESKSRVNL